MSQAFTVFDDTKHSLDFPFDYNVEETAALRKIFAAEAPIRSEDLHRAALWKLNRIIEIPDEVLQALEAVRKKESLHHRDDDAVHLLESLVACQGVGYPMASTFLKFVHPDVFPIIDVRAYRALYGQRLQSHQHNTERYLTYVDRCCEISAMSSKPLSEIDEQLYLFDKAHNGPI